MSANERPSAPLWWYGLVALAVVLAVLWLIAAVVGLLLALVKVAIVVILVIAALRWAIVSKARR